MLPVKTAKIPFTVNSLENNCVIGKSILIDKIPDDNYRKKPKYKNQNHKQQTKKLKITPRNSVPFFTNRNTDQTEINITSS